MDYIMKIFGHFEAGTAETAENLNNSSSQELLGGVKSTRSKEEIKEDDPRRKYLSRKAPIEREISAERGESEDEGSKRTEIMGYLRNIFRSRNDEPRRLERDENGYVKKLYCEREDSHLESDEKIDLMSYVKEFFSTIPKQFELTLGDDENKAEKLLAKVITQHGNEWFQDMDDENSQKIIDEENDSIKKIGNESNFFNDGVENLLAKLGVQRGNEWFQDLDERGDTELHQGGEGQIASFLNKLFAVKTQNVGPDVEYKGDGPQVPEEKIKIFSYLKDLLEAKLEEFNLSLAQHNEKVEETSQIDDVPKAKAYLRQLFGTKGEKDVDVINSDDKQAKSEEEILKSKDEEVGSQAINEYDVKIRAYLDGLFESTSEGDFDHIAIEFFPEESEEIASVANDFEVDADDEEPAIELEEVEEEIVRHDWEDGQERCDDDERNLSEIPPPSTGLINCAVNVAKIFSRRNYPPDDNQVTEEELGKDEDVFEEALDEQGDEELNLPTPSSQKVSLTDLVSSHKRGSVLQTIFNSGYKYILPQSPLLQQCRQFLHPPNTNASPNQSNEEKPTADESSVSNGDGSTIGGAKNEDVFEDARDFLTEKARGETNSYPKEEVIPPSEETKREIRFLVGGEDSQIIIMGKDEEEVTTLQDVPRDFGKEWQDDNLPNESDGPHIHSLTISAPEIPDLSKTGGLFDVIRDPKLGTGRLRETKTLRAKRGGDNFEEAREITLDLTDRNILDPALFHLDERFGGKIPRGVIQSEIQFPTPEEHDHDHQDVRVPTLGKNDDFTGNDEMNAAAQKMLNR